MSEWREISTVPFGKTVVVGRHDWEGPVAIFWAGVEQMNADLENWVGPPTHWLDGLVPPPHQKDNTNDQ